MEAMRPVGSRGSRAGQSFRDLHERIAERRPVRPAPVKPEPVVLHLACPQCKAVFETTNVRKVYCSDRCVDRAWKKKHRIPVGRVKKAPVMASACPHPDKKMVAHGKCHACYMVDWRKERKVA